MKKNYKHKKKKNDNNNQKYIDLFLANTLTQKYVWNPPSNINFVKQNSNSWFDILKFDNGNSSYQESNGIKSCEFEYSHKIKIYPDPIQYVDLINWMESYRLMMNETNKFIRQQNYNKKYFVWRKLRDTHLKDIKKKIMENTAYDCLIRNKKIYVNSHIMDKAIQDVCASYKASFSLHKGKRKYCVRYQKQNKRYKYIKIEKYLLNSTETSFCSSVFGNNINNEMHINNNKYCSDFTNIKSDFIIRYDSRKNDFWLISTEKDKSIPSKSKNCIGLDPGSRTFLTGYSFSDCIEIGNNLTTKLKTRLKKIDDIKKDKKTAKKNALIKRLEDRIKNIIDDMHWKTCDYLTKNYGTIFIGNMSTKKIISNETSKLSKMTKRILLQMKLYKFRERLEYICKKRGVYYKMIDESYTTMTCSKCGTINKNIGTKKVYDCRLNSWGKECQKIGRDINGAKNILQKGLHEKKHWFLL